MKKNVDLTNCLLWAKKIVYSNLANLSTPFLTPRCISYSTSVAEEGERAIFRQSSFIRR